MWERDGQNIESEQIGNSLQVEIRNGLKIAWLSGEIKYNDWTVQYVCTESHFCPFFECLYNTLTQTPESQDSITIDCLPVFRHAPPPGSLSPVVC